MLCALGIEHYEPVCAFSAAGSFEIFKGSQGQVQHAALSRTHGSETEWLSAATNTLSRRLRGHPQLPGSNRLEVLCVEGDLVVLFRLETNDLCRHVLKR